MTPVLLLVVVGTRTTVPFALIFTQLSMTVLFPLVVGQVLLPEREIEKEREREEEREMEREGEGGKEREGERGRERERERVGRRVFMFCVILMPDCA